MKSIFILSSALILLSSCNPKPQQEAGAKYKTLRVEFSDRTLKPDIRPVCGDGSMSRYVRK